MSFCLRPNVCNKCGKPLTLFEGWTCLECEKVEQEPILDKIRAEIEHLHYHPKLDFIKNDEVVEMALDIIDKQIGAIRNDIQRNSKGRDKKSFYRQGVRDS